MTCQWCQFRDDLQAASDWLEELLAESAEVSDDCYRSLETALDAVQDAVRAIPAEEDERGTMGTSDKELRSP